VWCLEIYAPARSLALQALCIWNVLLCFFKWLSAIAPRARNMHLFDIETSAVLKVGRRAAVLCWDIVKRSKYCREKIYYKRYMYASSGGSAFIERLSICRRGEGENNNAAALCTLR
jgi:hypothetical protein